MTLVISRKLIQKQKGKGNMKNENRNWNETMIR